MSRINRRAHGYSHTRNVDNRPRPARLSESAFFDVGAGAKATREARAIRPGGQPPPVTNVGGPPCKRRHALRACNGLSSLVQHKLVGLEIARSFWLTHRSSREHSRRWTFEFNARASAEGTLGRQAAMATRKYQCSINSTSATHGPASAQRREIAEYFLRRIEKEAGHRSGR